MNALTEWAAFAGILLREAVTLDGLSKYDAHVDRLLLAIEKLSEQAKEELIANLEEARDDG